MDRVGIADQGGSWLGVSFDLPGCEATAPAREALLEALPLLCAEHRRWLKRAGVPFRNDAGEPGIEIVEDIRASESGAIEGEFCFADDQRPLQDDDFEYAHRVLDASRSALLAAVDGIADIILDWRPPRSAMARLDEWKPEPLTIREILQDIAGAEGYYRRGLRDGVESPDADPPGLSLGEERGRLIAALRALPPDDRGRVFRVRRPWQADGEEHWTARKVVRRAIAPERFHTAEIQQRLCWLLLGVPRFGRD